MTSVDPPFNTNPNKNLISNNSTTTPEHRSTIPNIQSPKKSKKVLEQSPTKQQLIQVIHQVQPEPKTTKSGHNRDSSISKPIDNVSSMIEDVANHSTMSHKLIYGLSAVYWLLSTTIFIPILCIAIYYGLLMPISYFNFPLFLQLEQQFARWANEHWVAMFHYYGINVREFGDELSGVSEKRCILMANHLGLLDHFILMSSMHENGTIAQKSMWVIFHIWQWCPLGIAWSLHDNYFINGGRDKRAHQLNEFRAHLEATYWKNDHSWVVLYPEGSRLFLIKDSNTRFATQTNRPRLEHTALPRTGAFHAILKACGPVEHQNGLMCDPDHCPPTCHSPIKYIVDATIGYPGGEVAGLDQVLGGEIPSVTQPYTASVHYRIFDIHAVQSLLKEPVGREERLRDWLTKRWVEKDQLLDQFYKTGRFPGKERPIMFDPWRMCKIELIWAVIWYIQWKLWIKWALYLTANFFF